MKFWKSVKIWQNYGYVAPLFGPPCRSLNIGVLIVCVCVCVCDSLTCRARRAEAHIRQMLWKVNYSDLVFVNTVCILRRYCSSWRRGTLVERRFLTGELSLSCAQPAADGWPLMWVNRPLQVSQLGQTAFHPFWVDKWVVSWNQMCAAVYR